MCSGYILGLLDLLRVDTGLGVVVNETSFCLYLYYLFKPWRILTGLTLLRPEFLYFLFSLYLVVSTNGTAPLFVGVFNHRHFDHNQGGEQYTGSERTVGGEETNCGLGSHG